MTKKKTTKIEYLEIESDSEDIEMSESVYSSLGSDEDSFDLDILNEPASKVVKHL